MQTSVTPKMTSAAMKTPPMKAMKAPIKKVTTAGVKTPPMITCAAMKAMKAPTMKTIKEMKVKETKETRAYWNTRSDADVIAYIKQEAEDEMAQIRLEKQQRREERRMRVWRKRR